MESETNSVSSHQLRTGRRGRPRKEPSKSTQLNSRRERNRIAQNTFRLRQKATEKEREKEVEQLERTIDHVVSTFSSFAESVVESPWARKDTTLIDQLRQSMQSIRTTLSHGGVPPRDGSRRSIPPAPLISHHEEVSLNESNDETVQDDAKSPGSDASTTSLGSKDINALKHAEAGSYANHTHAFISNRHHQHSVSPEIETNIFGNGWMMLLPPMANISSHHFAQRKALDSPFSIHVALSALKAGYDALIETKDTSQTTIKQIFGHVLQYRTREEVLFNLRWYLGPGIGEIDQVALASFNNRSPSQFEKHILGNRVADGHQEGQLGCIEGARDEEEQPVCNANDVAKWIRLRTVMELDDDTLELSLSPDSAKSRAIKEPATYMRHGLLRLPNPPFIESVNEHAWMERPVLISKSLFLRAISNVAFCLYLGPAFGKLKLEDVVRLSIISR